MEHFKQEKIKENSPVKQNSKHWQEHSQPWASSLSVQLLQGSEGVCDTTTVMVPRRKLKPGCGEGQASKIPTYLFLQPRTGGFQPIHFK